MYLGIQMFAKTGNDLIHSSFYLYFWAQRFFNYDYIHLLLFGKILNKGETLRRQRLEKYRGSPTSTVSTSTNSTSTHFQKALMKFNLYDFASKSPTCTNSTSTNCHQIPHLYYLNYHYLTSKSPHLYKLNYICYFVGQCKNVLNLADGSIILLYIENSCRKSKCLS